jgi:hypothetical protein
MLSAELSTTYSKESNTFNIFFDELLSIAIHINNSNMRKPNTIIDGS